MKSQPKKMYALETLVSDNGTGIKGKLTHAEVCGDGSIRYVIQADIGSEVIGSGISEDRVEGGKLAEMPKLPWAALKKTVTDTHTGFTGRLVSFLIQESLIQAEVQPVGLCPKTNQPHDARYIDITQLRGEGLPEYDQTDAQVEATIRSLREERKEECQIVEIEPHWETVERKTVQK